MATWVPHHNLIYIYIYIAKNIVVVAAKSTSPPSSTSSKNKAIDPNSSASTITTVAQEINDLHGTGTALAIPVDTRSIPQINALFAETMRIFNRLDVLIYNSGAVWWSAVETTPFKRFQLMQQINPEGLYASIQAALPCFERNGWNGRIVVVSPPIYSRFFRGKTAYAMGMPLALITLGVDFG
jgi:NAD(P)-dependent dehydrogenase (short-subunit alcohol dehydrogenase family)